MLVNVVSLAYAKTRAYHRFMSKRVIAFMKRIILAAVLLALPAISAEAASSDWTATKGGKLRLVAMPPETDGTIRGFIEIMPQDGWHTYWKVPGSGGIPPQVTIKHGSNATLSALAFPPPRIFTDGKLRDFGYDGRVMLPLTLKQVDTSKPSTIGASIFIGLCADICVPFQANVAVTVAPGDKASAADKALVRAAEAMLPERPGADFAVEKSGLTDDGAGVRLTVKLPPGADPATATFILIGANGEALSAPSILAAADGAVTIEAQRIGGGALEGQSVDLLASAAGRAMETTIAVK